MRLSREPDGWHADGVRRRDFRHDPGTPDTEVPRHHNTRRKKKTHVHTYERIILIPWEKTQQVCTGCGNRRTRTRRWRW